MREKDYRTVCHYTFSPDGKLITYENQTGFTIWDLAANQLVHELENDAVSDCAFSPDGQLLVTTSYCGTAAVWSVSMGECLGTKTNCHGEPGT